MRITHLACTDAFAGVEQYIAYVSRQQSAIGHQVIVLGGSAMDMPSALAGSNVRWRPAPSVLAAVRTLPREPGDVVHVHMTAAEVAAITTKPLHRRPVVATLHFAQERGSDRFRSALFRQLPRFLDAQISISRFVADRSGVRSETILNGVPWDLPSSPRHPVVLVAQRFEHEKDTETAIRGWAASGLARDGWRLEIAGQGSQEQALRLLVHDLDVDASVDFLGFVPNIKQRMTEASIFLATAPEEPFGLSVVEAMAAGTPVVAADGGAHRETVGSAHDAVLFQPGSATDCAAALETLSDDSARRDRYGAELQRRWAEAFTLAHHCEQLDAVYRHVIAQRKR